MKYADSCQWHHNLNDVQLNPLLKNISKYWKEGCFSFSSWLVSSWSVSDTERRSVCNAQWNHSLRVVLLMIFLIFFRPIGEPFLRADCLSDKISCDFADNILTNNYGTLNKSQCWRLRLCDVRAPAVDVKKGRGMWGRREAKCTTRYVALLELSVFPWGMNLQYFIADFHHIAILF